MVGSTVNAQVMYVNCDTTYELKPIVRTLPSLLRQNATYCL